MGKVKGVERSQYLTSEELRAHVMDLARAPELWRHLVEHGAERQYSLLEDTPELNSWLICWSKDHDTGFHDHDGSAGAFAVVEGTVVEDRMFSAHGVLEPRAHVLDSLSTSSFGPYAIHRVRHDGDISAVTIHAYSPPLTTMGSYWLEYDELQRWPSGSDHTLRPLEQAVIDS